MQEYIDRLLRCGWRLDNACVMVSDFYREQDIDGLEYAVQREEEKYRDQWEVSSIST